MQNNCRSIYKALCLSIALVPLLLHGCSSSDDPPAAVVPTLTIGTTEFIEGSSGNKTIELIFNLSEASTEPIQFTYNTATKSAVLDEDFNAASGNLTIAPGNNSQALQLSLIGDEHLEFDEIFLIEISNISNASMSGPLIEITILDDDNFTIIEDQEGFITPIEYPSMELVWSDEFDANEPDSESWNFEVGNGCPNLCGWGNEELQHYTEENTELTGGKMIINAENPRGSVYTSSRITTKGKREFKYGRIDIRAKLPFGQGIWPALWMLGANIDDVGWPICGEIDIMEMIGQQPSTVHGTAHFDRGGHEFIGTGWSLSAPEKFVDKFHVFTILWQPGQIEWFVDYNKFFTLNAKDVGFNYPFDDPFFFIANVAVGGQWPGEPDETTQFPQLLEVDYIRVFQTPGL